MMSAKNVVTETCPTPSSAATAAQAPAAPGDAPSDFQNTLATAATTIDLSFVDTMPTIPIAQLLGAKPQLPRPVTIPASTTDAAGTEAASPDGPASDLLQLLTGSSTLLPDVNGAGGQDKPEVHVDGGEPKETKDAQDGDILAEWMEAMIPQGVFAPQAGSHQAGEGATDEHRGTAAQAAATSAIPASLLSQAGLPDAKAGGASADAAAAVAAGASSAIASAVANATSNVVQITGAGAQAAAAILADSRKADSAETRDSRDGWMNTMNHVAGARGQDVVANDGPRLSTPVHDARWADALAHRLVLMARDGQSVAQLKLVPQDLGPLDIQISVRDGEASVHFGAAHPETRAALESSMPRLRELLSSQGLQLANASVSHQSAGQQAPQRTLPGSSLAAVEDTEASETRAVSTSLLDLYA